MPAGTGAVSRNGRATALLGALLFLASSAGAVVLVADDREVVRSSTLTPSAPFAPFDVQTFSFEAGAGQTSAVDSEGASGSGYAYSGVDSWMYGAGGRSTFDITFTVAAATPYSLSGELEIEAFSSFLSTLTLYQGATALASFTASWEDEQVAVDVSGVLAPGTYRLVAEATAGPGQYGSAEGYAGASYDFVLVVPEPRVALLVALGLLALAVRSRRG